MRHYRPADLARLTGVSAQTVRAYERLGFLPPAARSPGGHRRYGWRHRRALEVSRAAIAGYGWVPALDIMRAAHRGDSDAALALADARHARLDRERRELEATLGILRTLSEDRAAPRGAAPPPAPVRVGEAARGAGVRVSALHFWEGQGLLTPRRDERSGYRLYDAEQIRRLRVVTLLRRAGYDFPTIRAVIGELAAGDPRQALAAAERRLAELAAASRRAAAATAALWGYVEEFAAIPGPQARPLAGEGEAT